MATSNVISGPMRLLFPRFPTSLGEATGFPFSLLGLGDVAIPGLLACLALRYDSSRVVDLPGRAAAAVEAIVEAMRELGESEPGASGRRMGDVASDVAHRACGSSARRAASGGSKPSGCMLALAGGGRFRVASSTPYFLSGLHRAVFPAPFLPVFLPSSPLQMTRLLTGN